MKLTFVYRAQRHQYSLDKTPMKTLVRKRRNKLMYARQHLIYGSWILYFGLQKEFFHQFCQEHELDVGRCNQSQTSKLYYMIKSLDFFATAARSTRPVDEK